MQCEIDKAEARRNNDNRRKNDERTPEAIAKVLCE